MKLSVIMPVYNERRSIKEIIQKVKDVEIAKEIIIVDDGSIDGTKEILKNIQDEIIQIYYHDRNLGKGAALVTGFSKVSGDIIIVQDADLEYDPADYFSLIEPIKNGIADVVYGSRLSGGKLQRVHLFWHKMGNLFLTFLTNILYDSTLTDMETGYKAFRADVIKGLRLNSKDFAIEPEITAKILKRNYRIYETPISYCGRNYKESKKIRWWHGINAIWVLIKYRFVD